MKYHDVEQGSDTWFELRRGRPTASNAHRILTPSTLKLSKSSDGYIAELISERLSPFLPERVETYTSRAMRHGQETEEEARRYFALREMTETRNGGFCTTDDGKMGCSPDSLLDPDGVLELKAPTPPVHVEYLMNGGMPEEYKPQCHMHLIVTGRKYCKFMSYCIGFPALIVTIMPDIYTIQLKAALDQFCLKLETTFARIKGSA